MADVYRLARRNVAWRELGDAEARMFLECVARTYGLGDEAMAFRLTRRDLSYGISPSRFGAVKKRLLKRGLISRQCSSLGARLRDYFVVVL